MNYCNKSGVLLTDIRWRPISAQSAIPLGSSLILIRRVSTYVCLYHGDNMKLFNVINDFWIHLSFVTIKKKKKRNCLLLLTGKLLLLLSRYLLWSSEILKYFWFELLLRIYICQIHLEPDALVLLFVPLEHNSDFFCFWQVVLCYR